MIKSTVLKTVFDFCKKHWKELLLTTCLFAFVGKSHLDYKRLENAYETSQESLKTQIVTLKDLHADELLRRDEALKEYQDTVKKLEKQYETRLEDLEKNTEEHRDEIIEEIIVRKQFSENKAELAEKVELAFGFEYVP